MGLREIFKKIVRCFKKQKPQEKIFELPYKIERPRKTIEDVEAEFIADGFKIIRHEGLLSFKTVPVKKHKKYRIQKKWIKRYGINVIKYPFDKVCILGDKIIGHPETINKYFEKCLKN